MAVLVMEGTRNSNVIRLLFPTGINENCHVNIDYTVDVLKSFLEFMGGGRHKGTKLQCFF